MVAGGKSYYQSQVQMNPVSLYATPDGTGVVATSQYCEDNRSVRMYNNDPSNGLPLGLPSGPFVNDSTTNQHLQDDGPGVDSVLDASNLYTLAGGFIAKSARSHWAASVGTTQNPGVVMHAATLLSGTGYGIALIGSRLYVIDSMTRTGNPAAHTVGEQSPAHAALRVVPTSLASIATLATVPYARKVTPDRQGNLWVLAQGVIGSVPPTIYRYSTSGTLLASWAVPSGVYPLDICADPTSDTIWLADNGPDLNFKAFNYAGTRILAIGRVGGYMASSPQGKIGPTTFIGPRGISIDSAGNYYLLDQGFPNQGAKAWDVCAAHPSGGGGTASFISKLAADRRTQVWRVYSQSWGGAVTTPASNWSKAHGTWLSHQNVDGVFEPYAFNVDYTDANDHRLTWGWGSTIRVWDADSHQYMIEYGPAAPTGATSHAITFYRQDQELFHPVLWLVTPQYNGGNRLTFITPSGTMTSMSFGSLSNNAVWVDDSGNIWVLGDASSPGKTPLWELPLQGFDANGVPQYSSAHVNKYALPAGMAHGTRLNVFGSSLWISGYPGTPPSSNFDFYKQIGHLLIKASLPSGGGTPRVVWSHTISYPDQSSSGFYTYPITLLAAPALGNVTIMWNRTASLGGNPGYAEVIDDATGGTRSNVIHNPLVASQLGWTGTLDQYPNPSALIANDWVWLEDNWANHTVGWKIP